MKRTCKLLRLAWILPALVAVWSAGEAPAGPDDPAVTLRTLGSAPLDGRLVGLSREEVVIASSRGQRHVPLGGVLALDVASATGPTLSEQPYLRLVLTGGGVLVGRVAGAVEDGILLDSPDARSRDPEGGPIPVPFDAILSLVPVPAEADPCYEPERPRSVQDDDVAHVRSLDTYTGIVLAATDDGFEIETGRGDVRKVRRSDLLVLHFANDPLPRPEGLRIEVETVEGARLVVGGDLTLEGSALRFALRSLPDLQLAVPLNRVRSVRTSGGRFVYASELDFESEYVTYYQEDDDATFVTRFKEQYYHARVDRRPGGCPLRLGGRTFRHGFAVQARTRITIPLKRAFERFDALFGVDDLALELVAEGIVDARVLADGEVVWKGRGVREGADPRRVGPIEVSDVDVLVLEVDYGENLYFGDRATWADPILVRK